ncbi:unnamed protein product [Echinostoma caproni]|uniref:Mediator complex subunit 16 n=1 Tax=Echinostoma caproni TaxID=27848 RepID=A0A183A5J6_9TREM|nr:unnamed protein product [Echinostoma caproni]
MLTRIDGDFQSIFFQDHDAFIMDSLALVRLSPCVLSAGKTMIFNIAQVENNQLGSCRMEIRKLTIKPQAFMVFPKPHEISTVSMNFAQRSIQDQTKAAFYDLNTLLWEMQALEEVYSLGQDAGKVAEQFATHFSPVFDRKKWLCSNNGRSTAHVIFVSDLALIDPVACIEPYTKPNHLLDSIFAELCPDGHSLRVTWDSLCSWITAAGSPYQEESSQFDKFTTDLLNTHNLSAHPLFDRYLLSKEQEALTAIQQEIQDVADAVNYSLPELTKIPRNKSQWSKLLLQQVQELMVPICESGKLDLLVLVELAMAVSLAFSASPSRSQKESHTDSDGSLVTVEKLLMRYERSLIVASQLDAKLLSQLEEPTKCEPIIMQAINQARQALLPVNMRLTYLEDIFMFLVYILGLLPAQYPVSNIIWRSMTDLMKSGQRGLDRIGCGSGPLIPTYMSVDKLIHNLKDLLEERRKLPSYNRYIPLGGSGPHSVESHNVDYVIIVIMGSVPFALVRDLLETAQGHADRNPPFQLKIIANRFIGGTPGLSGFFKMDE